MAGAFYGAEKIPPEWRTKLAMHDLIVETLRRQCLLAMLEHSALTHQPADCRTMHPEYVRDLALALAFIDHGQRMSLLFGR